VLTGVVAFPTVLSWNQIVGWLREMDGLRSALAGRVAKQRRLGRNERGLQNETCQD